MPVVETVTEAFKTDPGEGRTPEPLSVFGHRMTVKVASRDTGGAFAVIEDVTPPFSGPPLHIHHEQDEWWHVLEGVYRFEIDGREVVAGPGMHVFAARGTRHTFQNLGAEPARMAVTVVPGGLDLFFEEISAKGNPDPAEVAPLFEKHGMSLVGPPLAAPAGSRVAAVQDGAPEPLRVFNAELTVKISSHDTGGALAVVEGVTPPLSGPPLHIHYEQDEYWHVLEGTFRFVVDGREILAGPGAHVFAPRGIPHTFQNLGETPGRTVAMTVPGGFDLFFQDVAAAVPPGTRPDPAVLGPIADKHRVAFAGPPLPRP